MLLIDLDLKFKKVLYETKASSDSDETRLYIEKGWSIADKISQNNFEDISKKLIQNLPDGSNKMLINQILHI